MRIRYKKWARPELEACHFYVDNSERIRGKWKSMFKNPNLPLYLELGCGKGTFIAELASSNKNINFLAIDLIDSMLGLAKRNIEQIYKEKNEEIDNVLITRFDIERINLILSKEDEIERIYINFCNPWPRGKHHKKRLTHPKQLEKYKDFLKQSGEIFFKTDDDNLYFDSLNYFENSGFKITEKTEDLHQEENFWENIITEHEEMFSNEGIKIKAIKAMENGTVLFSKN